MAQILGFPCSLVLLDDVAYILIKYTQNVGCIKLRHSVLIAEKTVRITEYLQYVSAAISQRSDPISDLFIHVELFEFLRCREEFGPVESHEETSNSGSFTWKTQVPIKHNTNTDGLKEK